MDAYKSKFEIGSKVRIESRGFLEEFIRTWKYHHKLSPAQLEYAGQVAAVQKVGFYHGGDALYDLVGIPGTWHEQCLSANMATERVPSTRGGARSSS